MVNAKKLDTFILRDKFNLSAEALTQEAQASAVRRSEIMGWTDVSIRPLDAPVTIDGEYKCFSFEVWGVESSVITAGQGASKDKNFSSTSGIAAPEVNS
ncbi:MAG: hypothetical protein JWQ35_1305 [Bacteriovoracaceae bacterium]|nr:hypothetical protein [Bacteriovoracaceae bacterium]